MVYVWTSALILEGYYMSAHWPLATGCLPAAISVTKRDQQASDSNDLHGT